MYGIAVSLFLGRYTILIYNGASSGTMLSIDEVLYNANFYECFTKLRIKSFGHKGGHCVT